MEKHTFGENGPEGRIKTGMEESKPVEPSNTFDGMKSFSAKRKKNPMLEAIAAARMGGAGDGGGMMAGMPMMGGGGPMGGMQ